MKQRKKADEIEKLKELARLSRKDILNMIARAGEGHIASALSCVEILCTLYFCILNIDPKRPKWTDRDRFILSKGHAAAAIYSVLARRGFFPVDKLNTIGQRDTIFGGHPDMQKVAGIEVSTGSLGHGLSIGAGMALAAKRDKKKYRVFALLSDGECQEGSVWEAAMFASAHKLDNLTAIVDFNRMQAIGHIKDVVPLEPFEGKWKSFGWNVRKIDGHSCNELLNTLTDIPISRGAPSLIIARTIKGKGVSFMENKIMWHARATSDDELKQALSEIDSGG